MKILGIIILIVLLNIAGGCVTAQTGTVTIIEAGGTITDMR